MWLYGALAAAAAMAAVAKSALYAATLPPADFGVVALAMLVVMLGTYPATCGLQDALARVVPLRRGRLEAHADIRSTALTGVAVFGLSVSVLTTALILVLARTGMAPWALLWAGPLLFVSVLANVSLTDLQSREYSQQQVALLAAKSALPAAAVAAGVAGTAAQGVLVLEVTTNIVCALAALLWRREGLHWRWNYREVLELVKVGRAFTVSNAVHFVALSTDRWMVQAALGVRAFGVYAFGSQIVALGLVVLNVFQMYLTPRWLRSFTATARPDTLLARSHRRLALTILGGCVAAIAGHFVFDDLVRRFWPAYVEILPAYPYLALGAVAVTCSFFDILFLAAGRGRALIAVQLMMGGVTLAGALWAMLAGAGLEAYALAFAVGRWSGVCAGWVIGHRVLTAAAAVEAGRA